MVRADDPMHAVDAMEEVAKTAHAAVHFQHLRGRGEVVFRQGRGGHEVVVQLLQRERGGGRGGGQRSHDLTGHRRRTAVITESRSESLKKTEGQCTHRHRETETDRTHSERSLCPLNQTNKLDTETHNNTHPVFSPTDGPVPEGAVVGLAEVPEVFRDDVLHRALLGRLLRQRLLLFAEGSGASEGIGAHVGTRGVAIGRHDGGLALQIVRSEANCPRRDRKRVGSASSSLSSSQRT